MASYLTRGVGISNPLTLRGLSSDDNKTALNPEETIRAHIAELEQPLRIANGIGAADSLARSQCAAIPSSKESLGSKATLSPLFTSFIILNFSLERVTVKRQ